MNPGPTFVHPARFLRRLRSWDTLAVLFLAAWPFIYYWPVTIGQKVFSEGDIQVVFLPTITELARSLREWRLPLWTTGIEGGFPLFAAGQTGALYPPNALLFWLSPLQTLSFTVLFHKAWIALGMYLFCRSFGLRSAGAFLAGMTLSMGGFITARVPHITLIATASWLPWLLSFQIQYWRAKRQNHRTAGWLLLICFGLAVQYLAGYPPIAFFNVATFGLLGVLAPWVWGNHRIALTAIGMKEAMDWLRQSMPATALQLVLGAGLAAIQLLPTAELTGLSNRAQGGIDFFTSYSMEPQYLTQFIAPFLVLGQPEQANMEYWAYIGVLPLFLALAAPLLRRDARTWFFFALALLTLALALGKFNPLYQWLYYIPVFNQFRVPARILFLFSFTGAFLAGIGLEELRRRVGSSTGIEWVPLGIATAFGVAILLIINLAYTQSIEFWLSVWGWLPALLILLRVENLILAGWRPMTSGVLVAVTLGIALFDLSSFSAPFLTSLAQIKSPTEFAAVPRTIGAMDDADPLYRAYAGKYPPVTLSSYRAALLDNSAMLYGKQAVMAHQDLDIQRNRDYIHNMSPAMRNLMNIRYYLSPTQALPEAYPLTDQSEPEMGLSLELLRSQPRIPPTRTTRVDTVSYTDQSGQLPDGFVAGEIVLTKDTGEEITLPIRMGKETSDWAFDALAASGQVKHGMPADVRPFRAFLGSVGHEFQGKKVIARYDLAQGPFTITAVGVRPFLPGVQLNIESICLIDPEGRCVSLASLLGQNDTVLAFRSQTAAMWENRDVLPRAFIVRRAEILDDRSALARLRDRDFRPDQVVLLSDVSQTDPGRNSTEDENRDQVAITSYQSESVTVNVKTSAMGYLVLTDSWYPGWIASVDGRPTPILRADYIFRAVPLDPGEHAVSFEFHPQSLWWGSVVSGISVIASLLIAWWDNRRKTGVEPEHAR